MGEFEMQGRLQHKLTVFLSPMSTRKDLAGTCEFLWVPNISRVPNQGPLWVELGEFFWMNGLYDKKCTFGQPRTIRKI